MPPEAQIKNITIGAFLDQFATNSPWSKEIEESLDYQKSAFLATAEDCHLLDCSFYYEDSNGIYFLPIHLINETLSYLHLPLEQFVFGTPSISYSIILNKLRELIKSTKAKKLLLNHELVQFLQIERNLSSKHIKSAQIDLTKDEETIFKGLSKGHKSSVKAGQKILSVSLINAQNFSENALKELINLYSTVAKRNKADKYWDLIQKAVLEGSAFFTLATYNSAPASCQLFFNGNSKVTYALAAYDRDLMSQGLSLSHWPLFYAILESKRQGFKVFDLGYVFEDNPDEKVQSIFKFKSKFVSDVKSISFYEFIAADL